MKKLLCLAVPFVLFAAQKQTLSVDECNKIFEQRKAEIAYQIEKLEEKEQSLSAFQNANKNVQTQKEQKLSQKLAEINKLLAEVAKKEQNTKAMLDENKKVLDAIQKAKDDKITQSYVKMKPGPAAGILSEMNSSSAAQVLFSLEPKKASEILSKMEPKKASEAMERLRKGPPF